jgi:hypothetical protein
LTFGDTLQLMARGKGDSWFDGVLLYLTLPAVLVVFCGCVYQWSWVTPPDEGAGPFRSHQRVHDFVTLLAVLGGAAVLCLARAWYAGSVAPVLTACALAAIGVLFAAALYLPREGAQIVGDGFGDDWYSTSTGGRFSFYNTTGAPVTICLGISGDCDSSASGPGRLRAPGLTIPPDHRLAVDLPGKTGDFKLTIVGSGYAHRDAVLHVFASSNSGP